jgi:YihY family inner membrane protein
MATETTETTSDSPSPQERFDAFQQRRSWMAFPLAVIKKTGDDSGGNLAALIAYYGFFSLFPLLLVFVTVLGFVLSGDAGAQKSVENSVLGQFPIINQQIRGHTLQGHAGALVIGLVTTLLAGLGVTGASQNAFNRVWAVPFKHRPNFLQSRLRSLLLLLALGGLFVLATVASGLVSGGLGGPLLKVAGIAVSLAVNLALFMASFKLLTSADLNLRELVPGAMFAAVAWEVLQVLGGVYIHHVVSKASNTYGTFALVIGVLAWLHLGAQFTLYGAELNSVLARRLYPRSLFGPPDTHADQRTYRALAEVEERSHVEHVDVEFHDGDRPSGQPGEPPPADAADAADATDEGPADRRPADPNEGHPAPWV